MNGNPILLDTNAVAALFRKERAVRNILLGFSGVALAAIVLGELMYGAKGSIRRMETERDIFELVDLSTMLPIDIEVAVQFAAIKHSLKSIGRLIPENDIWIAAIALRHGVPLLSRDAHFKLVESLELKTW